MPPRRPQIKPWLRPIGRRAGEVQFGVLPEGVIVSGVTPAEVQLLARLDGSMSRDSSFEAAAAAGVPKARWRALLDLVGEIGVLTSGTGVSTSVLGTGRVDGRRDRPSRKSAARAPGDDDPPHVLVDGSGTMSEAIAALLRSCGSRVSQGRPAVDLVVADLQVDPPRLAIVVGAEAIDPRRGDVWLSHATPALPVLVSGPWGSIGPVVEASLRSPCLWCLDLHRTDRDHEWPTLMAQLLPDDRLVIAAPDPDPDPEPALAQLVAGTVALLAERVLTGNRPPSSVSVEVSLPWPRMDHRRWTRHPRCRRHPTDRAVVA